MLEIGIVLLLGGLVGLIFGISKKKQVTASLSISKNTASNGGIVVDGHNNVINNTVSTGKTPSSFWDVWNIVCGLATLAGFILAILPLVNKL